MHNTNQKPPQRNPLETIGQGMFSPSPFIAITDPILFNTCLAMTASNDEVRHYLQYLLISPEKNTVTGSCGSALASGQALNFSAWNSKSDLLILPAQKLPKETRGARINVKEKTITGRAKKGRFNIPFLILDAKYPSFNSIEPTNENTVIDNKRTCFNVKLLMKMQKASQCEIVTISAHRSVISNLFYSVDLHSKRITSPYRAIIMPCNA